MSTSPDDASGNSDDFERSKSRDEWDDLGHDEQADMLVGAMQESDGVAGGDDGEWAGDLDDTQRDTLAAIGQSLEETWTAEAFGDDESTTTIPFEMYQLSEKQQETVLDHAKTITAVEESGAADAEELADELGEDVDTVFDSLDDIHEWLNEFLAETTTGETFDGAWWVDR